MNQNLGPEQGDDKPEIKIVDRRSFTTDGRRRAEGESGAAAPEPAAAKDAGAGASPSGPPSKETRQPVQGSGFTMNPPGETDRIRAGRDAAFLNLCVSLYESGCIHLGLTGEGAEGEPPRDLEAARGAVEMLEMLKRKTHGNLSEEEQQILDSLLAELQMAYVMKAPGA